MTQRSGEAAFRDRFATLTAKIGRRGMGAAFARGDTPPVVMVAGCRHRRSSDPIAVDAPWHIGSITKSVTASLVLRLVEQKRLALDTPIGGILGQHVDDMHPDWQAVTLRRVLSHTAGLPANVKIMQLRGRREADPTAERLSRLRALWTDPLEDGVPPFSYSNIGYVLAGVVAEQVARQSWEDLIVDEIATPLGLSSLGFGAPTGPGTPWGHRRVFGVSVPKNPGSGGADNPDWMRPAGGLHLSLADLAAWGQVQLAARQGARPDFLSGDSCAAMHTPVADDYGFGWVIQAMPGDDGTLVWHNGSNTLWYAVLAMVPERDLVVAVAMNRFDQNRGDAALEALIRAVLEGS